MSEQPKVAKSSSSNSLSANRAFQPDKKTARGPGELWEDVLGTLGLILVIGMIGFLLYQGLQPDMPPAVMVEAEQIVPQEGGYLVQILAFNHGDVTATSAVVEGTLVDSNGNTVETSEITFDYIPPHSQRHGGLVFYDNPDDYNLELQFRGYTAP